MLIEILDHRYDDKDISKEDGFIHWLKQVTENINTTKGWHFWHNGLIEPTTGRYLMT